MGEFTGGRDILGRKREWDGGCRLSLSLSLDPLLRTSTGELPKVHEKAPKDDPADVATQAERKDSRFRAGKTSQLEDASELVADGTIPAKKRKVKKPGISTNGHAAAETELLHKNKTSFVGESNHLGVADERTESGDDEQIPGERMRRRKRASSYNSRSSKESGQDVRRPTDLFQAASANYENAHIRDLPSCFKQASQMAADPLLALKYDPTLRPWSTKQRDDVDKVAAVLPTLHGGGSGNVETDHSKLVERTIFALRGFGEFQVRCGHGAYGKELNACLRRLSAYGQEEVLASVARCLVANRMSYGFPTLKIGTYCRCKEGDKASAIADFTPPTVEEWETTTWPTTTWNPREDTPSRCILRNEVSAIRTWFGR